MTKKIDIEEYGRKVFQYKDNPSALDAVNCEMAGWYAYYQNRMIPLERQEAEFWRDVKGLEDEKPKSDAIVRALWKITEAGMDMAEIERILKTLEKLMSTCRSSIRRASEEMRNQI